ncbi:unnamed protein product, partial [Rotaria sp. Silwood2]
MKAAFYSKLDAYLNELDTKRQAKYLITAETYEKIVQVLSTETKYDPQFNFWAKKRFTSLKINDQPVVYSAKEKLPIVKYENLFETLNECHLSVGHLGRDKTWHEVKRRYAQIPLELVKLFLSLCDQCASRKTFPKPVVGKPIVSVGFMTRIQMDLIDMRSNEFNGFKWIFHAKDHFSKYSWLFPLASKEAINVANILQSIFYQFGPPKILQSDNGREFVAKVITDLTKTWSGLVIVNGRPRHPQFQGLVERSNSVVQQLLGKWLSTSNSSDWPSGLGPVMLAINTSIAKSINKTPFEVVFGQHPRTDDDIWKSIVNHQQQDDTNKIILDEDLPDDIAKIVKETDYADSELISDQDDNDNERLKTNEKMTTAEYQKEDHVSDDEQQETIVDHEECIDGTESTVNDGSLNINLISNGRHRRVREEAEQAYLKNAQSQLVKYKINSAKRQRTYVIGDIVGLKVSDVDRTNTSSTILPCKIIEKYFQNNEMLYMVATQNGIIKERFNPMAFLDLTTANFASLRAIDTDQLPTITFIQASQLYTNFKSIETCKCAGNCNTNRCY